MRILALDGIHADGLTLFRDAGYSVETADPIKDVARQVGYADQFYFSKDFKRFTAMTPTATGLQTCRNTSTARTRA